MQQQGTTTKPAIETELRPRWWHSQAPARPPLPAVGAATITSVIGLMALAAITVVTDNPWLIPPLAASMALIVGAPQLPLAQPRNVIGGQIVSAAVGVGIGHFGDSLWLAALAGGLALGTMILLRMPHSPAAATAMIGVSTGAMWWEFILLAGLSAVVLVVIGGAGNRFNGAKYPVYLW